MNERKSIFDYKVVNHDADMRVPINLADRVVRNQQGQLIPANGFENFHLMDERTDSENGK